MANGSRRTWPSWPNAAAVISEPIVAAEYTPNAQLKAWETSGTAVLRRPPKMNAEIGTPLGSLYAGSADGHWPIGAVKRLLGWAAFLSLPGAQSLPCQSIACFGGSPSMPSHHTSPSSVSATLVKIVSSLIEAIAFGLVFSLVPGATPKKPASGLIA